MNWTVRILGEPCAHGTATDRDDATRQAWEYLRKRSDYSSVLAVGDATLHIHHAKEDRNATHPHQGS